MDAFDVMMGALRFNEEVIARDLLASFRC